MGALAMALGVMAIVGANWESIPAWLKLAVDLGLNGACAVAVFVFWRQQRLWLREIAALLLFGLVLSGIALIGQVYQLQSAPWRALVLWLALCTPFLARDRAHTIDRRDLGDRGGHDVVHGRRSDPRSSGADRRAAGATPVLGIRPAVPR